MQLDVNKVKYRKRRQQDMLIKKALVQNTKEFKHHTEGD